MTTQVCVRLGEDELRQLDADVRELEAKQPDEFSGLSVRSGRGLVIRAALRVWRAERAKRKER